MKGDRLLKPGKLSPIGKFFLFNKKDSNFHEVLILIAFDKSPTLIAVFERGGFKANFTAARPVIFYSPAIQ